MYSMTLTLKNIKLAHTYKGTDKFIFVRIIHFIHILIIPILAKTYQRKAKRREFLFSLYNRFMSTSSSSKSNTCQNNEAFTGKYIYSYNLCSININATYNVHLLDSYIIKY